MQCLHGIVLVWFSNKKTQKNNHEKEKHKFIKIMTTYLLLGDEDEALHPCPGVFFCLRVKAVAEAELVPCPSSGELAPQSVFCTRTCFFFTGTGVSGSSCGSPCLFPSPLLVFLGATFLPPPL
jgi:hypothetical protein